MLRARAVRRLSLAALVVSCSAFAWSRAADAEGPKPAKRYDASNQTAISESMEAVVQGSQKFVNKDVEGALQLFHKAVKLQPRNAVAQYVLGEALSSQGKFQEAEAALVAADDAAAANSPAKPRILFVLASVRERMHKWDDAKEIWKRYLELAQQRGADSGMFPESATERLRLVDEWNAMDSAYANVRARISQGASGTAAADGGAPNAAGDAGK